MEYGGAQIGQLLFALLLVVLLILGIAWTVRRLGGVSAGGSRQLRMVAALPVGTRERIAVIEVGGRQILVGITSQSITTLMELPEPLEPARGQGEFARNLQSLLRRQENGAKGELDDTR